MTKGTFCISLDTELIWGRIQLQNHTEFIERANTVHQTIPKLLKLFDKYKTPVTWAIVGHIMLDHCDGKHKNIKLPRENKDWFSKDPGDSELNHPAWYGSTLLKQIQKYKYHDIGCHTYSHLYWNEHGFSETNAVSDIKEWKHVAKKNNINAISFIYPKNQINYLNVIFKNGFRVYRGEDIYWYNKFGKQLQRLLSVIDLFLPIAPSVSLPLKADNMMNVPGSQYFVSGRGMRKFIPKQVRALKAKRGIDRAIESKKIFHLWTHPIDFSDDTEKLLSDFEEILRYASQRRDEGKLEILSLKDIYNLKNV